MSKLTKRALAPRDEGSIDVRLVPRLPAEQLHQLIKHRGLEASAELVAAATAEQLNAILDLDLWRHTVPGQDHAFDVERFGEWLEVLIDAGDAVAARTVATMNADIVMAGLSRYVRVFDPGIFEPTAHSDDEAGDRHDAMREGDSNFLHRDVLGDRHECEVGGYVVRARRVGAWDAIVALLIALESDHNDRFHALMRGCRALSNSRPEACAFDDLLMAPEQHLHDLTVAREDRLSQQGYIAPADARAFLELARGSQGVQGSSPVGHAIVAAYFRAAAESAGSPRGLMVSSGDAEEAAYLSRARELAFLANTLVAGCSIQARPFTVAEASDAAAATCKLGLERIFPQRASSVERSLISAFEAGWSMLHHEVSLFTADRLIEILGVVEVDREHRLRIAAFRRALVHHREAGRLWKSRAAAEVVLMLDPTVWISIIGLLDECPVIPATLDAILHGRTDAVSQTEFTFISTASQIDDVRRFVRRLPELLSR